MELGSSRAIGFAVVALALAVGACGFRRGHDACEGHGRPGGGRGGGHAGCGCDEHGCEHGGCEHGCEHGGCDHRGHAMRMHDDDRRSDEAMGGEGAAETRHFGEVMAEVARRFERSGRSVVAGRWDLAAYDIGELEEVFEDDLPETPRPEGVNVNVGITANEFAKTRLPELARAAGAHDRAAFERAYASAADACNACHRASAHPFIEVPGTLGEPVPRLTPAPASPAPAAAGTAAH